MARLKLLAGALALCLASPASSSSIDRWRPLIAEASTRFGVPQGWIERVMKAESRGRPYARSPKGAMGLMQLMSGTWADMRASVALGGDPYDPHDNVLAGTLYLRFLYDRFGYPGLFAAYNAGLQRYADQLTGKRALPLETRAYVAAIAGTGPPLFLPSTGSAISEASHAPATLFFALSTSKSGQ